MLLGGQTREFNMLPFLSLRTGFDLPLVTHATPFADEILSFAWKNGKPLKVSKNSHCMRAMGVCRGLHRRRTLGARGVCSPQSRRGRVLDVVDRSIDYYTVLQFLDEGCMVCAC